MLHRGLPKAVAACLALTAFGCGGTTTFLAFNNPGTGSSPAAHRSILTGIDEFRRVTASDSAVDYALSPTILGGMDDPLADLPAMVDAGIPTAKAFMVFDFRLGDRELFEAMRLMGQRGGMLQVHCEDPVLLDAGVSAALQRGDTLPRYHATSRPAYVQASREAGRCHSCGSSSWVRSVSARVTTQAL